MKRYLNLMSNRSCVRARIRTRLWQWSMALAAVVLLLVPTWFFCRWPVLREGQHVATLEAQYEPYRQMHKASEEFQKRIDLTRAQEKTALALAQVDTPVITLIGLVGKAVAENHGRVVVEKLDFNQSASVLSEQVSGAPTSIAIKGQGIDKGSVERLTNALKIALPFSDVKIESSSPKQIGDQQMQEFLIKCTF